MELYRLISTSFHLTEKRYNFILFMFMSSCKISVFLISLHAERHFFHIIRAERGFHMCQTSLFFGLLYFKYLNGICITVVGNADFRILNQICILIVIFDHDPITFQIFHRIRQIVCNLIFFF